MNRKWVGILASSLATLALAACDNTDPEGCPDGERCECVGSLEIAIELAQVPAKMRATFGGDVVLDDCLAQASGIVLSERTAHALTLSDGGFGYTPPSTITVELFDQGDCSGDEALIFSVHDEPVPGAPFTLACTSAAMFFAASEGCYGADECDAGLTCSAESECLPPPNCGDEPCPEICYGYCVAP